MLGIILTLVISSVAFELETRQNISSVPVCAQTCLSNSTASQGSCSDLDIKCLCTNTEYVNSLSCCLATTCSSTDQQKAIAFNQQECESVNETAPGFVGCSPFSLSSFVFIGTATNGVSTLQASTSSVATTLATTSSASSTILTVTGSTDTDYGWDTVSGSMPVTKIYSGGPLLTGSCTIPYFGIATDTAGQFFEYPEMGCSPLREGCCPYEAHEYAYLNSCPPDYTTTAGACCPSGWQIYFTALGMATPCYSLPSETLTPAMTPTISGITVITNFVFTKKYNLPPTSTGHQPFPTGAKAGFVLGVVLALVLIGWAIYLLCTRRRRAARKAAKANAIPRTVEMAEPVLMERPHELASPQSQPQTPGSPRSVWPVAAVAPPAYEQGSDRPRSTNKSMGPQELPGSTYIHEHHPAHASSQDSSDQQTTTVSPSRLPRTPTRSPGPAPSSVGSPRSPVSDIPSPPLLSPEKDSKTE